MKVVAKVVAYVSWEGQGFFLEKLFELYGHQCICTSDLGQLSELAEKEQAEVALIETWVEKRDEVAKLVSKLGEQGVEAVVVGSDNNDKAMAEAVGASFWLEGTANDQQFVDFVTSLAKAS